MSKKDMNVNREFISRCFDLNNLSFLIGSGMSKQFNGPTIHDIAGEIKKELSKQKSLDDITEQWIEKHLSKEPRDIEAFLDILYLKKRYLDEIGEQDKSNDSFIDLSRKIIFDQCSFIPNSDNLNLLFIFLNSLVNRKSGLEKAQLFTLNYDLLIEHCSDELGILINDGFDGSIERWLNPSKFDVDFYYPSGVVGDKPVRSENSFNYYKLHGSLNWIKKNNRIIKGNPSYENMIIYPCQIKYDMMLYEPFLEIFRRFSVAIKRPKSALITIGYSFADAHINQIILQALEQPNFHLIIIDPKKDNIKKNFPNSSKFSDKIKQLNINFEDFVDTYLPRGREDFLSPAEKVVNSLKKLIKE